MRNAIAATKVKMSGSEKKSEQEHIQHFLHKTYVYVGSFWKFQVVVVQDKGKNSKVQKSVLHVQSCFLLIRPIVVVFCSYRCLHHFFSITRFYLLCKLFNWVNYSH